MFELGIAVRSRRRDMGLTQVALARLSGLSRATVNQIENGTAKELGLARASRLLSEIGLSLDIAAPRPLPGRADSSRSSALDLAARTASVSYRVPISAEQIGAALSTGTVPTGFRPHMHTLLDEAPVSLLASVAEQLHAALGTDRAEVWRTMRALARESRSSRGLWR